MDASEDTKQVYSEKHIGIICQTAECGKDRGYDKNYKNWVKGYCGKCYQAMRAKSHSVKQANHKEIKSTGNKRSLEKKSLKSGDGCADFDEIIAALTGCVEKLSKSIVDIQKQVIKNKGTESAQRFKLFNRVAALEAFIRDTL